MKKVLSILFALANITLGAYLMYDGWHRGGIFLLTVFFAGAVMFSFGIAMLFVPSRDKKRPAYKDIFIKK
ncbi:hypothetical protein ACFL5J_02175 [Thermodesulfobacteriota bacterium]